ncbi:AAA family ATPase [Micromonospora sp. M12]
MGLSRPGNRAAHLVRHRQHVPTRPHSASRRAFTGPADRRRYPPGYARRAGGSSMSRLIATRGLPASGKTTFARTLQPSVVRVSRDDLRRMLHGERLFTQWAEAQVTAVQRAQVEALLRARADVCVDDTNLRARTLRGGPTWPPATVPISRCTTSPTCRWTSACAATPLARPSTRSARTRSTGCTSGTWRGGPCRCRCHRPRRTPAVVHPPSTEPPEIVLVDIDGTVALAVSRSPYDMTRVGEDQPNTAVIAAVRAMHAAGYGWSSAPDGTPRPGRPPRRGWPGTYGCRTSACTCGPRRLPQGLDRQAGDLRPGDPGPLSGGRRLRRPRPGGPDVASPRPHRLPGGRRRLLSRERSPAVAMPTGRPCFTTFALLQPAQQCGPFCVASVEAEQRTTCAPSGPGQACPGDRRDMTKGTAMTAVPFVVTGRGYSPASTSRSASGTRCWCGTA